MDGHWVLCWAQQAPPGLPGCRSVCWDLGGSCCEYILLSGQRAATDALSSLVVGTAHDTQWDHQRNIWVLGANADAGSGSVVGFFLFAFSCGPLPLSLPQDHPSYTGSLCQLVKTGTVPLQAAGPTRPEPTPALALHENSPPFPGR